MLTINQIYLSISPTLLTVVTSHKSCHGLIRCPDLFLILTICGPLVTVFAFLTSVLIYLLLHLIIVSCLISLNLFLLYLGNVVFHLLIEVQFFIILCQLERSYQSFQHSFLRLTATLTTQTVTYGHHFLVQYFVRLI